jgi:very-short-patch-repair endonuclease
VDDRRISRLVAAGALNRVHGAVFLVRGAPWTYTSRQWSAVLAVRGVLGFASAAHVHGYADPPELIHVIRPDRDHLPTPKGVRIHRVPVPPNVVIRVDGLPVTTPRWSLIDHLGRLPASAAFRLADRAFQQGWLDPSDLDFRLRHFKGRKGNALLHRILEQSGDQAAAESERLLHRLLKRAGIAGWRANHRVVAAGRVVAVVDVAIEDLRIAIEVDGWAFHSDVDRFQRDRTRQNELVALGWTVLRFTWTDLNDRPDYVVAAIRAAIANLGA